MERRVLGSRSDPFAKLETDKLANSAWQPERKRRIHRSADADPACVEGTRACNRRIEPVPSLLEPARIRTRALQWVWGPWKRRMRRLEELEGHISGHDDHAVLGRRTARGMLHASCAPSCGRSSLRFRSFSVVWWGYRAAQRFARAGRACPRAGLAGVAVAGELRQRTLLVTAAMSRLPGGPLLPRVDTPFCLGTRAVLLLPCR